ncbi:hypothetical protein [Microcoleus sp. bin38.metabat.b11b12b14.051]|uniref:hypothetical protein n=1 Tax=Microcoleus sp. bin38.metabat.b11b12b14.051 TaxID=2742709 RepID=UPI0025F52394|nr:hypothetical protein [Microcoleus sp. bin38.metabat.b11b12b14.051]
MLAEAEVPRERNFSFSGILSRRCGSFPEALALLIPLQKKNCKKRMPPRPRVFPTFDAVILQAQIENMTDSSQRECCYPSRKTPGDRHR